MIPKDVIEQIVGNMDNGHEEVDELAYIIYKPTTKYPDNDVMVDFKQGIVEVYDDNEDIKERFAIKVTLEPITST